MPRSRKRRRRRRQKRKRLLPLRQGKRQRRRHRLLRPEPHQKQNPKCGCEKEPRSCLHYSSAYSSRKRSRIFPRCCGGETSGRFAADEFAPFAASRCSRTFFILRRSTAAFSRRLITAGRGNRFSTIKRRDRSARSQFRFQILTLSTSAAAKDCIGLICRSATGFISRRTRERPGRI